MTSIEKRLGAIIAELAQEHYQEARALACEIKLEMENGEPSVAEVMALHNELERERMRLAACGTAALGYFTGCVPEYRSASLDDVLRLRRRADQVEAQLGAALEWTDEDKDLPEDEQIGAAHPCEGGDEHIYGEAMRMVGAKRSKGALVDLVNWLLTRAKKGEEDTKWMAKIEQAMRRSKTIAGFLDRNFWSARFCDIRWRIDGQYLYESAGWMGDVWYAVRRHEPGTMPMPPAAAMSTMSGAIPPGEANAQAQRS